MNHTSINLFDHLQKNLMEAIKTFLSKKTKDDKKDNKEDSLIPISLRIHADVKSFFECVAEAGNQSFSGVIQSLLENIKNQTIAAYEEPPEKIRRSFECQINSVLSAWIITTNNHNVDYDDLALLLGWLNNKNIDRKDLIHTDSLILLFNKEALNKFCYTFGYNYGWLLNKELYIHETPETFDYRWYKNCTAFVQGLIKRFYLDETVESFNLSFLCSDREVVRNIQQNIEIEKFERITTFVIANRKINGLEVTTYHLFETNDINYEKCRKYLVALIKIVMYLVKKQIMRYPNGYTIKTEELDRIMSGKQHLSDYFRQRPISYNYPIEDLADIKDISSSEEETVNPDLYNILNSLCLFHVLESSEKKNNKAPITEKMASKFGMTPKALEKFLRLYECNTFTEHGHLLERTQNDDFTYVNLEKLRIIKSEIDQYPRFNTSFG